MTHNVELDFDTIKQNLKDYFQGQAEFSDYDFEGSALTILIDALAYATHQNAMIANLSHSEAYLDSAIIRKNVVSRAKELGYIPNTISSAIATVTLSVDDADIGSPASFSVPANTKFTTDLDGNTFTFFTPSAIAMVKDGSTWSASLDIVEGVSYYLEWTYDPAQNQRFVLPNANVDSDYLNVKIDHLGNVTTWTKVENVIDIDGTSEVYFLQESYDGYTEVYFGDNVLGKALTSGDGVRAEYVISEGEGANGCSQFALVSSINGKASSLFTTTLVSKAAGGADRESIDSVKHAAPKMYQAQNRAVTVNDYIAILRNNFGYIDALNVWGGEDNDPPQYGRVYISIKPNSGLELTGSQKSSILELLAKYSVVTITPEIVTPEYLHMNITSDVTFDKDKTSLSKPEIVAAVETTITNFFDDLDSSFAAIFRMSKLTTAIDATDPGILGNLTSLTFTKKFDIYNGSAAGNVIRYRMEIEQDSISSTTWTGSGGTVYHLADDSTDSGLYLHDDLGGKTLVGNVDYAEGRITINALTPDINAPSANISLTATPSKFDVEALNNDLMIEGTTVVSAERYEVNI